MIAGLANAAIGLLGIATGLIIYLYAFTIIPFRIGLERWPWSRTLPITRQRQIALAAWLTGAAALWAAVLYALPDWWLNATPLLGPAIAS